MKLILMSVGLLLGSFAAQAAVMSGEVVLDYKPDQAVVTVMNDPAKVLWDMLKIKATPSKMFPGAIEKDGKRMHCTEFPANTQMNPTKDDSYVCKMGVSPSGNVVDAYFAQ